MSFHTTPYPSLPYPTQANANATPSELNPFLANIILSYDSYL